MILDRGVTDLAVAVIANGRPLTSGCVAMATKLATGLVLLLIAWPSITGSAMVTAVIGMAPGDGGRGAFGANGDDGRPYAVAAVAAVAAAAAAAKVGCFTTAVTTPRGLPTTTRGPGDPLPGELLCRTNCIGSAGP
mmetsp:Transcript_52096/g.169231  ORF Transcript_52096/g.169231 Transcript_52096/m.169231 type:complete len:136 (+) Transcript_52096:2267-2674(+)